MVVKIHNQKSMFLLKREHLPSFAKTMNVLYYSNQYKHQCFLYHNFVCVYCCKSLRLVLTQTIELMQYIFKIKTHEDTALKHFHNTVEKVAFSKRQVDNFIILISIAAQFIS